MKSNRDFNEYSRQPKIIHELKLRVLRLLLFFGPTALVIVWLFEYVSGRIQVIDQVAYPIMICVFYSSLIIIYLRPSALKIAELASFLTFSAYAVIYIQFATFSSSGIIDNYGFASFIQWFPLVYLSAFIFFETRRAITASIIIYIATLIPNLIVLVYSGGNQLQSDSGLLLINMLCAHPVYIVTLRSITNLKSHLIEIQAQEHIMRMAANVDYLTGIANRRATAHRLHTELTQAQHHQQPFAVILIDIDHFKHINDTCGHDVGDQVLIEVAKTFQKHLGTSSTYGRWGGEEFLVALPVPTQDQGIEQAETLRKTIAQRRFEPIGQITSSFGVAFATPNDTPETLVKRADAALYQAKIAGRNRVVVAEATEEGETILSKDFTT